ncbi:MAG: acyl-phosphate glycerol 3-phosphate acyltransferase [Candidatus Levybacteria bacterium RIFCSPHIGHO2_02_FULL_37_13]|nr:MAG: acyl-phosphate glycerol 3-phosphate acyltransferase [Candidatus Levybacteria bacterium RIFCSPHIGHO2_02_FULL_37_13]OGH30698.1 MAG: acyl-phosphate glycerol 3-phosphate acyltransferase [Candidatus Levybacteria bacterium RIFCSPHIGHO2_12_FULL_37_9]
MNLVLFILFSYLLGSIPVGKLVGRKYGIDIQKKGSGNIGATNALRLLGLKPAVMVLVLDVIKGFIPVKLALQFLPTNQVLVIGVVTILAHIFPIWLKFKGGKGVATGLGVVLAINPLMAIVPFIVFLAIFLKTKIVSLGSILGVMCFPIVSYLMFPKLTIFYLVLFLITLWTHRENISRLIKGTEKRIMS